MSNGALTEFESSLIDMGQRQAKAEHWRSADGDATLDRLCDIVLARLMERVYPTPGLSMLEHEQLWLRHDDIPLMNVAELADHRARLRLRLMLDPSPDSWFLERLQKIEARQRETSAK